MRYATHNITTTKQAICFLLVVTLLSLTLLPIHYHFHHVDAGADTHASKEAKHHNHESDDEHSHQTVHVSEVHKSFALINSDVPEGSHTMEPASDFKLMSIFTLLVFAFLVLSLLVTPVLPSRIYSRRLILNNIKLPCLRWYKSPPLRAPPVF
jgi:hypothetical protein